jgi:hypothetical protein
MSSALSRRHQAAGLVGDDEQRGVGVKALRCAIASLENVMESLAAGHLALALGGEGAAKRTVERASALVAECRFELTEATRSWLTTSPEPAGAPALVDPVTLTKVPAFEWPAGATRWTSIAEQGLEVSRLDAAAKIGRPAAPPRGDCQIL